MPVRINSLNKIKKRLKIDDNGPAQAFLTETCYKHMDKYVPYRDGNLRTIVDINNHSITYESPYAHYQYKGKKYVMDNGKSAYYSPDYGFWSKKGEKKHDSGEKLIYHTPGTGPRWDKRMLSAEKKDVIKEVKNFIKNGGK